MNKTKAKIIFQEKQKSGTVNEFRVKSDDNVKYRVEVLPISIEIEVICYYLRDAGIAIVNLIQSTDTSWKSSKYFQEKIVLAQKMSEAQAVRAAIAALDEKVKAFPSEYPSDLRTKEQIIAEYLKEEEEDPSY